MEEVTEKVLSFGEKAVGISFNPSNNTQVEEIKQSCAKVIDYLNNLRNTTDNPEQKRMYSVAITDIQSGQMWGVKAATWQY